MAFQTAFELDWRKECRLENFGQATGLAFTGKLLSLLGAAFKMYIRLLSHQPEDFNYA